MTGKDNSEIVAYRLRRAKDTLNEINIQIENELWATAINRLYYACFYAVSALLLKNGFPTNTHSGTRNIFGQNFVKTDIIPRELGKYYTEIFDKRLIGDYDDFVSFTREEVLDSLEMATALINKIAELIDSPKEIF
jgi:uncharacterized protein (UPF0332 family)